MIRLLTGHVLDRLAELPDESVQCCVTSPPYYRLRDYGIEPQVWGGDPACEHEWSGEGVSDRRNRRSVGNLEGGCVPQLLNPTTGTFCRRCGAWRGSLGLEPTLDLYLDHMVQVCREIRRVLRRDGIFWLNIGDRYATAGGYGGDQTPSNVNGKQRTNQGSRQKGRHNLRPGFKPKDLMLIPARLAIRLQDDGWYVRSEVIWTKDAPMPESVTDRPTSAHEKIWLLTKSARYFYDAEAVKEAATQGERYHGAYDKRPGAHERNGREDTNNSTALRNLRNVWRLPPSPFSDWTKTVHRIHVAWDAPDDDKKRITSPDCPLHGDRSDRTTNARDDEHADDGQNRIERSDVRRAQEQQAGFVPIVPLLAQASERQNLDLPLPLYLPSATPHNNESRRTDLAPATNLPCSASARTPDRIEHTSGAHELFDLVEHRNANRISSDQDRQAASRSADNLSEPRKCTCEWYIEKTEKTSHFATFPPELPRRCIMAGTSQKGVCPRCGAPWARIVRKAFVPTQDPRFTKGGTKGLYHEDATWAKTPRGVNDTETMGWRPTCRCSAGDQIPATILDCFAGAGTTLLAADQLQRNAIGIELNPAYSRMANSRIQDDAPLLAQIVAD